MRRPAPKLHRTPASCRKFTNMLIAQVSTYGILGPLQRKVLQIGIGPSGENLKVGNRA